MLSSAEWDQAERYIDGELAYTSHRLSYLHNLPPDFTREQVSSLYLELRIGAGADRIAWATARDQAEDITLLKESGLPNSISEGKEQLHAWSSEIYQAKPLFEDDSEPRYTAFQLGSLVVARMHWGRSVGGARLNLFNTVGTSPEGYRVELGVDIVKDGELVATVDGNRTEPQVHIHISGEDAEKPWHYLKPPTLREIIQDSWQVSGNPSYPQQSGKFVQRAN